MLTLFNYLFAIRSSFLTLTVSIILVVILAFIDHITGFELSFSIFYLVPISLASWYHSRVSGIFICIFSSIVWLFVDYSSGHHYSSAAIPIWNAIVRFGFFIWTAYLLSALKTRLQNEQKLARTDQLTGIMNASAFKESAKIYIDLAIRNNHSIALGYIDLDNFKTINDTRGHTEGDQVLKIVAAEMTDSVRTVDLIARLGGDEFAILLPETDYTGAQIVFNKIRERLTQAVKREGWSVGFSIGVAIFKQVPDSTDSAVKVADALMYRVKSAGKNQIVFQIYDKLESVN
jgi:diguanylate cyclase (GGDEF)-like protein